MKVLSGIYGAVVGGRNSLFESKFFDTRRLSWPVISVGNVCAGGSGKTPFVIALGELLAQRNYWFDILSRGYRRKTRGVLAVNENGGPEEFGDEPLLIARKLRCPVIVGEDRYAAGLQAERDAGSRTNTLHLLDDGFQHRRLHRDFDIVLVNPEDLEDKLLPIGRLREPIRALQRADAVVVDPSFPSDRLPKGNFQIWHAERKFEIPAVSGPVVAFCGIARPQRFFSELKNAGLDVRDQIIFHDHHRYSIKDVSRLLQAQKRIEGSVLITTEKDSINLDVLSAMLNPVVVPMHIRLIDSDSALTFMFDKIVQRRA